MDEELKALLNNAKASGASDDDLRSLITMYESDNKAKKKNSDSEPSLQKQYEESQSTVQEPNVESPTKAVEQPISLATSKPETYDLKTQAKTQDFSEPFTVEKQGDLPKKEKDEASYSAEVWRSLQKGSTRLGQSIAATPEFIYEMFAIPQNEIAERFGIDILATDAEKFKDNIGVQNTIKDYYAGKTKELEQQSLELDRKYEGGITDNVKNGNIKDAFRLLGSSLAESFPSTLGIMVGGAFTKTPQLLMGITTVFGAGENDEAKENSPELSTNRRVLTSGGKGLAEGVFSTIGTARIGVAAKEIIAKEGVETGGKLLKENLIDIYTQLLKKAPIPTAMIGEGVEEAATQITQNAIDKYSAGKDEVNLMDNVSDAFIMGVGGGGVFGVALEGLKKVSGSGISKTDIEAVEPLLEKRESIVNELEQQVKDGDVTKEWASKTIENFDQIKEQLKAVPNDYNSEEKAKAVELLKEKSAIEKEIDGKDESLVTAKKERVNAIKEELKGIKTPQEVVEAKPIENAEIVPEKVEVAKPNEVAQNDIKANEEISPILSKEIDVEDDKGRKGLTPISELESFIGEDRLGDAKMENSRKTIDDLKEDILKNGFKEPIVLIYDKFSNGGEASIVEGNHRIIAAKELGFTEIPVVFEKGKLRTNEQRKADQMFPLNRKQIGVLNDTYGVKGADLGLTVRQPNENDYKQESQKNQISPIKKDENNAKIEDLTQKTDDELESMYNEMQDKGFKYASEENKEFNKVEKELEKREWQKVMFADTDASIGILNELKSKDNSFIEKQDANESVRIIEKYKSPELISDAELKKDFADALFGRPTTWYADGLKLKYVVQESINRGATPESLIKHVEQEFISDGFDEKTARETTAKMLKPILENFKNANPQSNDITPNGNIQLGTPENKQQGQDKNIQQAVEPKSDKNDVEVVNNKANQQNDLVDAKNEYNKLNNKDKKGKKGTELRAKITNLAKDLSFKISDKNNKMSVKGVNGKEAGKISFKENIAEATQEDINNAKSQISKGVLNWNGDIGAERVNLGIGWSDIRKGQKDINAGKVNSVPAKRLIEALRVAKENGGYEYVQGSGGQIVKQFVTLDQVQRASNENNLNDSELEEINANQSELYRQYKADFNKLDRQSQNDILDNYENKENNPREVQPNPEIRDSKDAIPDKQEVKEPTRKERVAERVKLKNAKIDDLANALKSANSIFGIPIKVKNIDDITVDGISQNALIDMIADIVKQAVAAGIHIDEAIKKTIEHFQKTIDFELNPNDIKAKLDSEKPKVEKKVVEPKVEKPKRDKSKSENKGLEGFRDKIIKLPNSGIFSQYLSGETIIEAEGIIRKDLRNNQSIEVFLLDEAGKHGLETIEMAKDVFGKEYVEKTIEFLDDANLKSHEKALIYVSLENDMANRIMANPESLGEQKLQDLVRAKSQQHLREASLSINAGKLRKMMKDKYISDATTNQMYSPQQLADKGKIQRAIEANMDALNNEAEIQESEPDFEIKPPKTIRSAKVVKLEIAETLKKMRADLLRVAKGDMALASIPYAAQLKAATPHIIKLSKLLAELGGMKTRAIINEIHNQIKGTFTDVSKQDISDILKAQNTPKQKVKVDNKAREAKEFVKQALIEQGFGREINVTVNDKDAQGNNILDENGRNKKVKQKRNVLDWKKLAGQEGSIEKIRKNVQEVLKSKGYTDVEIENMSKEYEAEYNDLRASVIEKSLNELERRNTIKKKVDIKSSAKRLAELFNYGLFEKEADTYNNLINSALGFNDFDNASFKELEVLAKSLAQLYATGKTEIELNSAITDINKKISRAVSNAGFLKSSTPYKITSIVAEFINLNTRFLLVRMGQLIENPFSGYTQRMYTKLAYVFEGTDNKKLSDQRRKVSKRRFKSIVRDGGNAYGDTSSLLINESVLENWLNNSTDSELNHAMISFYMGRAFLEGYDSRHKTVLTEGYFQYNLIKVLTSPTNPNRMSKEDALAFVTEKLTGKSFEDAKKEAREITEQTNKDAGKRILSEKERAIEILAQDIMKGYLLQNSIMTEKEVEAAYNAAYKAAGKDIGHVANNPLSQMVGWLSTNTQKRLDEAKKQQKWGEAALYTAELMFTRNIMNTFVGGGTNWVVIQLQKAGPTGLVSTAYTRILKGNEKIDTTTELGIKNLEKVMFNDLNYKNTSARLIIGSLVALVTASAFIGSGADDDLDKWLKNNKWARKYFDKLAPEVLVLILANKNDEMGKYWMHIVNNKLNIYDNSYKAGKALEDIFSKEETNFGGTGILVGSKLNIPAPYNFANDLRDIYRGVTKQPEIKKEYKGSSFLNGFFQGGLIDYLGLRPGERQSDIDFAKKMKDYASPSVKKTKEEKEETKEKQLERVEEDYKKVLEYNLRHPNNPIKHALPKSLQKKSSGIFKEPTFSEPKFNDPTEPNF